VEVATLPVIAPDGLAQAGARLGVAGWLGPPAPPGAAA
jgi:hypothetical protein